MSISIATLLKRTVSIFRLPITIESRFVCMKNFVAKKRCLSLYQNPLLTCVTISAKEMEVSIKCNTQLSRDHLTPEIQLHLITQQCPMWSSNGDTSPFIDPFWAFYWPGGQVLSRYILDNKELFRGKSVLDIGTGCGATAIACKLACADHVIANDIDPLALVAVDMNAKLNHVEIVPNSDDLIGSTVSHCNILLLGDMFYEDNFAKNLLEWLNRLHCGGTEILIGDPGRTTLLNSPITNYLTKVACYDLPLTCQAENNGLKSGSVWKLRGHVPFV